MNPDAIQMWDTDEVFLKLRKEIDNISVVDYIRCFDLYQFAKSLTSTPGAFAEVGVYRGGTARILAEFGKPLHLFDTFDGMPQTSAIDTHQAGEFCDTSLEEVQTYLKEFEHIFFHKGIFPESTINLQKDIEFSLVHVDVDIYESAKAAAKFFYPKLIKGGIMVFDDYGFPQCEGCKLAVDEFFGNQVIYLPQGHCIIIKR